MRRAVPWSEFDQLCGILEEALRGAGIELIIGVSRGGLPLAVALSHRLGCRALGTVLAVKTTSEQAFGLGSSFRVSEILVPEVAAKSVLLVDDVVALGDIFAAVRRQVREEFGADVQIRHACLFADTESIAQGPYRDLLSTLSYGCSIDNRRVWIDLPWERAGYEQASAVGGPVQ